MRYMGKIMQWGGGCCIKQSTKQCENHEVLYRFVSLSLLSQGTQGARHDKTLEDVPEDLRHVCHQRGAVVGCVTPPGMPQNSHPPTLPSPNPYPGRCSGVENND